jgi:hypothetical protein
VALLCDYCNRPAKLVTKTYVGYPARRLWTCDACDAWVGCFPQSDVPLGTLANAELRSLRQEAHRVFDVLWKEKAVRAGMPPRQARTLAYAWLAEQLGLPPEACHMAKMREADVRRVIEICTPHAQRLGH